MNLTVNNLSVQIARKTICNSLNISVRAGEIWGVLGPNGCGKTTLLKTLAGLHPLCKGEIFIGNHSLKNLTTQAIAQSLGFLFQDFTASFPQTVWEYCLLARFPHVAFYRSESEQDEHIVMKALQLVDLDLFQDKLISELSGGEKRRLAIASLLAQTPKMYLLDEPTNHLDIKYQIRILRHFKYLAKTLSATVIMSLHDINLAQQFCNHILLLHADGSVLKGPCTDILTAENLSNLYQHPINALHAGTQLFWQPELM